MELSAPSGVESSTMVTRVGKPTAVRTVAFVLMGLFGSTARAAADPPAATSSSRVLAVLDHIRTTVHTTVYRHDLRVDERAGRYEFDCSAMASWVLARSAPRALASVGGTRPLAVDFVRAITRAPTAHAAGGWQRVTRVSDAQPGDMLAWRRPPWFPSHNTGHVAFVVGTPEPFANGYLLRIADASSYNHEDDTRAGGTGFGEGVLLVTVDPTTGAGTGYGWFGRRSGEWIVETPVVIGRPTH